MSLTQPFTGTLYLPDKVVPTGTSPVVLADGQTVALVQYHFWTVRQRFGILDPAGNPVADGVARGMTGRTYEVTAPSGARVVELRLGFWRPIDGAVVTLASGRTVEVMKTSIWSDRRFEFAAGGRPFGRITPTTGVLTFHPDSYAFELSAPVMSALEAICLAQALRTAVRAMRQAASG
ncbi:LURP-one-related/scramblase family protein [Catellatospora vulcania]|uniref:hypothetical protein n=1 Tax=Catellatospora vulcania TaxID=1460450 RepID=UPI0012D3E6CF|nr:hypothetical protein [Catellatospora vulcania]